MGLKWKRYNMTRSVEIRDNLKDGFRNFALAAQTFLENETGVIPEEHKEYIEDQLKILVRHHLSSSDECKTMLKNLLLNT